LAEVASGQALKVKSRQFSLAASVFLSAGY
jgi:hypothetical protein